MKKVAGAWRRQGGEAVRNGPAFQQGKELRARDERDFGVRARDAERTQEWHRHDDVTQPVRQPDPDPRLARECGPSAEAQFRSEQIAPRFETEAFGRDVLVTPA